MINPSCECINWCRVDFTEEEMRARHHKGCERYNDEIRVVKITYENSTYIDSNIHSALEGIADGDDYTYTVELVQMLVREYEALPEFQGF